MLPLALVADHQRCGRTAQKNCCCSAAVMHVHANGLLCQAKLAHARGETYQGSEDQLCDAPLCPTNVKVVLMRKGCTARGYVQ